jgi:hypothetical protein
MTAKAEAVNWRLLCAADSLMDSSLSGDPFVSNAAGTGLWSEGDPFVGLESYLYWSATEANASDAWLGCLDSACPGGAVYPVSKTNPAFFVWPVRGGQ